jgi:hypothetical protein
MVFLVSCQKESKNGINLAVPEIAEAKIDVDKWIESKRSSNIERDKRIDLIKNNLDYSQVKIERLPNGKKIIAIP